MCRPLLSLWPYWWRGLIVCIGVIAWPLILFAIQPPLLLVSLCVLFGIEGTLVVRRFRSFCQFLWPFCLRVRRFKTQSRAQITIHYPPHLESQWNIQALLQRCESERDELATGFGFKLRRRLVVFLLDDRTMREVRGSPVGGFAMLLGNAIVLSADAGLEEVIRHELVHLFAGRWSAHARPLFNEGIAVWLQRTYGGMPIDARALRLIGKPSPSLSPLLSPKFFFADANWNEKSAIEYVDEYVAICQQFVSEAESKFHQ